METWRGASSPRGCEDPPRLHARSRGPERTLSRATVGSSYAPPGGSASSPPRLEGSHLPPGRATASVLRLEAAPTALVSVDPALQGPDAWAVHAYRARCRASSPGCSSGDPCNHRPIAPRENPERATVGGARAERTAHEGKPAFPGCKSARTARRDREMRARCVAIPADMASAESHRSGRHVWTRQDRRPRPRMTRCVARQSVRRERASHSTRHRCCWAVCVTPVAICRQACHDGRRLGRGRAQDLRWVQPRTGERRRS